MCVTCFFLDTARNVVEYLETIYGLLKPGGLWINCGRCSRRNNPPPPFFFLLKQPGPLTPYPYLLVSIRSDSVAL